MEANHLFTEGYFLSDVAIINPDLLKKSFRDFLDSPQSYRYQFLQKNYNYAFDGYSYLGQKDSSNQYFSDLLHSFVISNFCDHLQFPETFHPFFTSQWEVLLQKIRQLELTLIRQLKIPHLYTFYVEHIGHMISCNYYPKTTTFKEKAKGNTRLSAHTDVSLFTVFPFGFDSDFEYQTHDGCWKTIASTNNIVVFPGYLLDFFTSGKIKALNHRVKLPDNQTTERFSFAYFSLPFPKRAFTINGELLSSETYFKKYLALF